MMARLKFLEKAQYWPRKKILEQQLKDLQLLVQIAYEQVPFYNDLFESRGIKPEDIQSPADLRHLPIVTKDMLRAGFPQKTTRW